jgi:ankyrin repeat protein
MRLQNGADLQYNSAGGWSVLHYLFQGKTFLNTEYFTMFGDRLLFDDIKDSQGWTSLHRCATFGTAEDVRNLYLLGASSCIDQYMTSRGWNPVHIAAMMNNLSSLQALVAVYANRSRTTTSYQRVVGILNLVDSCGFSAGA